MGIAIKNSFEKNISPFFFSLFIFGKKQQKNFGF